MDNLNNPIKSSIAAIAVIGILITLTTAPFVHGQAGTGGVVGGTVNIAAFCDVSVAPNSIDFGNINLGSTDPVPSTPAFVTVTNEGNTDAPTTIEATDWTGSGDAGIVMPAESTEDNPDNMGFSPTTKAPKALPPVPGASSYDVAFQLRPAIVNPTYTGEATQTITITSTCL